MENLIIEENIQQKIYIVRGQKVMLDFDLAVLYQVETRILNQAVKRNIDRFPEDFMFQLNDLDIENQRSQFVIFDFRRKYAIYAFTEQGIAMLSSVLKSKRAIQVNIQIMRTFTRLREMLSNHIELKERLEELELRYDENFRIVFDAIRQLITEDEKPKKRIGFDTN